MCVLELTMLHYALAYCVYSTVSSTESSLQNATAAIKTEVDWIIYMN